jgi:hypothetical protein
VENQYKTTQTFTAIKKHYEVELLRNGWTIKEEHFVSNGTGIWSYVEKIDFCKGPYAASLGFADAVPESNFYFNVSWGISSCQQWFQEAAFASLAFSGAGRAGVPSALT